jgi:PAS domain-containing protein
MHQPLFSETDARTRRGIRLSGMSLHGFLTRLIWLCIVPLILVASYLAIDSIRTIQSELDAEAANLAKNFATAIDQQLEARVSALKMLVASPAADDILRRKDFYQEAQAFRQGFGGHVVLADLEMRMLFNTRVPLGAALPMLPRPKGRAAAPEALQTGAPAVGDVFLGPIAEEQLVAIAVPGKREGMTSFLLLGVFETRQFQSRLDQVALPAGWSLALVDGNGATIARRAPPGMDGATAVDGSGRFVVKSALSPWSVVLEIPRGVYRAPLVTAASALAILILGAILTGGPRWHGRQPPARRIDGVAGEDTDARRPRLPTLPKIAVVRRVLDEAATKRANAEAGLRESEQRFRLAASAGQVWDWNIVTNEAGFPQEFWGQLGYAAADIGNPADMFESVLHPEDIPLWQQAMKDHVTRRLPYDLDYRARAKSGEYRWFHTSGQAHWDETGRATYMAGNHIRHHRAQACGADQPRTTGRTGALAGPDAWQGGTRAATQGGGKRTACAPKPARPLCNRGRQMKPATARPWRLRAQLFGLSLVIAVPLIVLLGYNLYRGAERDKHELGAGRATARPTSRRRTPNTSLPRRSARSKFSPSVRPCSPSIEIRAIRCLAISRSCSQAFATP